MGWKNVKEHYEIRHIVHVIDDRIHIGSKNISILFTINADGSIEEMPFEINNEDIRRYLREMKSDRETLKRLIETPDVFDRSIRVYVYNRGEILEKYCDKLGYPNVTHDGWLMTDDRFSQDKTAVISMAKETYLSAIETYETFIKNFGRALDSAKDELHENIEYFKMIKCAEKMSNFH